MLSSPFPASAAEPPCTARGTGTSSRTTRGTSPRATCARAAPSPGAEASPCFEGHIALRDTACFGHFRVPKQAVRRERLHQPASTPPPRRRGQLTVLIRTHHPPHT